MTRTVVLVGLGIVLMSCAVPPKIHKVKNVDVLDAPVGRVWEAVKTLFEEKGWPVESVDEAAGMIISKWIPGDMGGGDYGEGGLATKGKPTGAAKVSVEGVHKQSDTEEMAVNIRTIRETDGTTLVRVRCLFRAVTSFADDGEKHWRFGTSRGTAEKQIFEWILTRL